MLIHTLVINIFRNIFIFKCEKKWLFSQNGCSLRMLNPQAFSSTVWNVLSILQEHFGSMAGANVWVGCLLVSRWKIRFKSSSFFFFPPQLPDAARHARIRPTLWRHWGICDSAGGKEALEGLQPKVRWHKIRWNADIVLKEARFVQCCVVTSLQVRRRSLAGAFKP